MKKVTFEKYLFISGLVLLTGMLGWVNYLLGYEISFSIFYWVPILLAAWFQGWLPATGIAVMSAFFWYNADMSRGHYYSHNIIPIWNVSMRFAMFVIVIYFAARLCRELKSEKEMARKDDLTGVFNFRHLSEVMAIEINRSVRFKHSVALAYIDLDNFKRANDEFGHDQGDLILAAVGGVLQRNVRGCDSVARLGGDEFVVFFPVTDEAQAHAVASKLINLLKDEVRIKAPFISFSIGVAVYPHPLCNSSDMIKQADKLMYKVKMSGKNNFMVEVVNL